MSLLLEATHMFYGFQRLDTFFTMAHTSLTMRQKELLALLAWLGREIGWNGFKKKIRVSLSKDYTINGGWEWKGMDGYGSYNGVQNATSAWLPKQSFLSAFLCLLILNCEVMTMFLRACLLLQFLILKASPCFCPRLCAY